MWICWRCLWNLLQTRGTGAGKKMRSRTFMKMTLCLFLMPPRMKRVIQKYRWMILSAFLELTFIIFLNICWKHTKTDADMKRVTCSKVGRTLPDCRRPVFVLTASAAHFCYFSEKNMTVLKKNILFMMFTDVSAMWMLSAFRASRFLWQKVGTTEFILHVLC